MQNKFPDLASNKIENSRSKEEIERGWRKELISKGRELGGVEFEFIAPKLCVAAGRLPRELDWNFFAADISNKEKEELDYCFQKLIKYLDSPIIIDDFPEHGARREWEKENLEKISFDLQAYYNSNRLGLNFASSLNKFVLILNKDFEDNRFISREILEKIEALASLLPEELQDGNGELYANLSNAEKITVTDKLAPIIAAVIRTLGQKRLDQLN